MKKYLLALILLSSIIVLAACGGDDSEDSATAVEPGGSHEFRAGVVVGDWSPHYEGAQAWADSIGEKTDGRIQITVFPDGQLGGEREMLEAVQNGSLDIGLLSSAVYSAFDPKMTALDIPFLMSTFEEAEAFMDGPAGEEFASILLDNGIRTLAWGHNDFRVITNNVAAVESPEVLSSIKMRVPESKVLADWYTELGAQVTPMPFPDIYTALQQGVVDGQDNGPILSFAGKLFEHQSYLTVSNHQYSPIGFFISEDAWAKLSEEDQALMEEAAQEAAQIEREAIRNFNEVAISSMEEAGLETYYLTDEDRAKFKETSHPFIDQIRSEAGDELVDLVLEEAGYTQ
ncbi:TRAP transporter substrate-binding protein [Planomicrobium sp. YIM 101495]|uniref:TRAP transporter substrate-binding protein n=1 Tax=Planomicrobium sp. YIM 101495 TaxID=2665160 RepID=UPI0018AACBC7|nr:TRAP transporter substrate-binding protein [Planomicrobium sp. YIM 101495]